MQIRDSIKAWRRNEDRRERVRGKAAIAFAVMAAVVLFAARNHHPYLIVFGVFCMLATLVWCFSSSSLPDGNVAVFDDCLLWIAQDAKVPEFAKAMIAIEVNKATQSARSYVFNKLYEQDDMLAELAFVDRVERGEGYRAIMTKRPPVVANVRDQIAAHYSAGDAPWSAATGNLAHAILERALSMPPAELRAFVASTANGEDLSATGDGELSSMVLMARRALL